MLLEAWKATLWLPEGAGIASPNHRLGDERMAKIKSTRLLMEYEGRCSKLLHIAWSPQSDVHIHPYRGPDEPFRPFPLNIQPGVDTTIRWDDFKPLEFDHNKVTFHRSGVVHSTDRGARRLKDGIHILEFSDIDDYHDIFVVVPRHPSELPAVTPRKGSRDVVFEVPTGIRPFYLLLTLFRAGQFPKLPPPKPPLSEYPCISEPGLDYGLVISSHFSTLRGPEGNLEWPPFTFWLARVG
jgi:hypothetical protein